MTGSSRNCVLQGWKRSVLNTANTSTFSLATLGKLLRVGAERKRAFRPSWGESETHVSEIKGDFQVFDELGGELWVGVKDLQEVVAMDLVQVTVGQRTHVAAGLAHCGVTTHVLSEHVVLACEVYIQYYYL